MRATAVVARTVTVVLATGSALSACGWRVAADPLAGLAPDQVVVSEIHYHDPADSKENSFVEIVNRGTSRVRIGGWCIEGIDFCFDDNVVLDAGMRLATPATAFGAGLSRSGERLVLVDSAGGVRDTVEWDDRDPWPGGADGYGDSLHRYLPVRDGTLASSWFAAPPTPNAPGDPAARSALRDPSGLSFSEIHYHDESGRDARRFIELVNAGTGAVDASGWCIVEFDFCLGPQSVAAGDVVVVDPRSVREGLTSTGGLTLARPDGSVAETVWWDDHGHWPALADGHGHSLQRRDPSLRALEPGNWVSAPPTRGRPNKVSGIGLLPLVVSSTHTVSPAAGAPVHVEARIVDATSANLVWRIGFGEERSSPMTLDSSGTAVGDVPGQDEGTLVRYRIVAKNGPRTGTWPRQGNGENWDGTVVASPTTGALPVMQWFMEEDEYRRAYADRTLYRDNGYPAVFAWNGEIMDNATVRIKGQQSRSNNKKKWKVALAPGDEWGAPELDGPVNEFALHSAATDKSYVREILTSDLQRISGGTVQQVFPLRLELNGGFYGLYLYNEQPDGRWRNKQGWSGDTVVYKGELSTRLEASDLRLPPREFANRYSVKPLVGADPRAELKELIARLASMDSRERLDFAYERLDIPEIVNTLAVIRIAQHYEVQHKNHMYVLDRSDMRWRFVAIDHDLNFGRRYHGNCGSFCDDVTIVDNLDYMSGNQLTRILMRTPELRAMVDRRTRTLADRFLAEGLLERRIATLAAAMSADAALDAKRWGQYGRDQTLAEAQSMLLADFVVPKRRQFLGPDTRLPASQYPASRDAIVAKGRVLTNTGREVVDLSGMTFPGLGSPVPAGVVLNPGQSVEFETERKPDSGRPLPAPGAPSLLRVLLPPR